MTTGYFGAPRDATSAARLAARYRKVTICARVQGSFGLKVVSLVPVVMPSQAAQMTAST